MTTIPDPSVTIEKLIDAAHENQQELPRSHLGCSMLGHPCDRWIWLSFRWAVIEKFPGRVLRLFRRGKMEEQTIYDDLEKAGMKIFGAQTSVNFGCHISGSTDGDVYGVPGGGAKMHVLECKTHSKKSFDDLEKNGVQKSKPQHWCQMQLYMKGTGHERALYYAVCKDDDRIYTERVRYDADAADQLIERGKRIVKSDRIPDPLSADPSWYQCKFCPAHDFCHKTKLTKEVNCRTCAFTTAEESGEWSCARWDSTGIPADYQRAGCDSHVLHPDLVPWERKPSENPFEAVYVIDGKDIRNGEGDAFTFSSKELLIAGGSCGHELVKEVKKHFPGATIVNKIEDTF